MKRIFKYFTMAAFTSAMLLTSCETVELELTENPNALTPEQADPNLLLNSIQINYRDIMGQFNGNGAALTRIQLFGVRDYFSGLTGASLDFSWSTIYAGMIPDIAIIEAINNGESNQAGTLNYQEGVSKALLAHSLMLLVDYIGDVPFSETNNREIPFPSLDDDAAVYSAALGLLDEAETLISGETQGSDLYYSDPADWLRFINTVRMKAALTTGDLGTFDSIVATGNFIATTEQDLQWQYGTGEVNPDERHPFYQADYTPSGTNVYKSNWLMGTMLANDDPRLRYYFFRQTDCVPGAACDPAGNGEVLSCSLQQPPAHYTTGGFSFCTLEDGYWGRDHGNDEGAPPDAFDKTAYGVYPAAGLLDLNNYEDLRVSRNDNGTEDDTSDDFFELVPDTSNDIVGLGAGAGGNGIRPIILASYVDFWRAERAMIAGNTGAAVEFIKAGIEKSIDKVIAFATPETGNPSAILSADIDSATGALSDVVLAGSLLPSPDDFTDFIDSVEADFNAGSMEDKWNILAEQYWIAMFGNGAEAYNFYRRQGYPTTLQPNLEPDPGPFPRSFPYANSEVIANPNVSQKADYNGQVFWDTNPPSAVNGGFPAAN